MKSNPKIPYPKTLIVIFVAIVWYRITNFWFDNYDLPYFNQYLNVTRFPKGLNFLEVIRGHVLLPLFIYPLSGTNPFGYYIAAILLHAVASLLFFKLITKLSRNKYLSFLLTLFFAGNIVYSNVLYEGAFNAYYMAILILSLASVYLFIYSQKPTLVKNFLTIFFTSIGLLFRETAIIIPMITLGPIVVFSKNLKEILKKAKNVLIPFLFILLYLVFRARFLGTLASDLTDDAVQARMAYFSSGRYLQYFISIVINIFRMAAEETLTYPILYSIRNILVVRAISEGIKSNFASYFAFFSGLFVMSIFVYFSIRIKRSSNETAKKMWFFGLLWFLMFSSFISAVLPFPDHVLALDYNYSSVLSRYNYYPFVGIVIMIGALALFYKRYTNVFMVAIIILIAYNFIRVQNGITFLNKTFHSQAKYFHQQIKNTYEYKFPNNTSIYYNFFQVNNLRDRVWELVYIFAKQKSPNSNFSLESTLSNVESNFLDKKISLSDVFAFDVDENGYLVDKTKILREALKSLKETNLEFDKINHDFNFPQPLYANFKYNLEFDAKISGRKNLDCDESFNDYLKERENFLNKSKVEVSSYKAVHTMFPYSVGKNLIDNQFSSDSTWQPDSLTGGDFFILDFGLPKLINGLSWASDGGYANPESYDILVSNDKQRWTKILTVTGNDESSRTDLFDEIPTRFIKMVIRSTKFGQPVILREVEALNYPRNVKNKQEWSKLIDQAYSSGCFPLQDAGSIGTLSWKTDKGNEVRRYEFFYLDNKWHHYSFPIINWEPYSKSLNILDERFTSIHIELNPKNAVMTINKPTLTPSKL